MTARPLILITNDDGIRSPGLLAAAEAVAGLGDLLLVAPATQQTSMGRAFVSGPGAGSIKQVELEVGGRSVPGFAVTGTPAMAVIHGVLELADRPLSLCVSGINYGENVGAALGVSGTIGAAFEAHAHGIPAIAASITAKVSEWRSHGHLDWTAARHFTRLLAEQVLEEGMPGDVSVLNLNVPREAAPGTELRLTRQSSVPYYVRTKRETARVLDEAYQFRVSILTDLDEVEPESDVHAIARDAVVSVTPLTWRMTADTDWTPRRLART